MPPPSEDTTPPAAMATAPAPTTVPSTGTSAEALSSASSTPGGMERRPRAVCRAARSTQFRSEACIRAISGCSAAGARPSIT